MNFQRSLKKKKTYCIHQTWKIYEVKHHIYTYVYIYLFIYINSIQNHPLKASYLDVHPTLDSWYLSSTLITNI